eukprot:Rmarinus@m.23999
MPLLSNAARLGNLSLFRILDVAGKDINSFDQSGLAPIHYAAIHNKVNVIQYIIQHKGDLSVRSRVSGRNAFHYAAENGNIPVLTLLMATKHRAMDAKDNEQMTPLMRAIKEHRVDCVKLLVSNGADINASNKEGVNSLHLASAEGSEEVVKFLLAERSCKISARDKNQMTAAHWAATKGHVSILQLLEHFSGDVEDRDAFGLTPLLSAIQEKQTDVVAHYGVRRTSLLPIPQRRVMVSKGFGLMHFVALTGDREALTFAVGVCGRDAVNSLDGSNRTPLHVAVATGNICVARTLMLLGASTCAIDKDGNTPLHMLQCIHPHEEAPKPENSRDPKPLDAVFVEEATTLYGADVNARNHAGCTPLHVAAEHATCDAVRAIMIGGICADIHVQNSVGETPLHVAVRRCSDKIVRLLYRSGATPELARYDSMTSLDLAKERNSNLVQILQEQYHYDWVCSVHKRGHIKTRLFRLTGRGIELQKGQGEKVEKPSKTNFLKKATMSVVFKIYSFEPSIQVVQVSNQRVDVTLEPSVEVRIEPCEARYVTCVIRAHIARASPSYIARCLLDEFLMFLHHHTSEITAARVAGARVGEREVVDTFRDTLQTRHAQVMRYINDVLNSVQLRYDAAWTTFRASVQASSQEEATKAENEAHRMQKEMDTLRSLSEELAKQKLVLRRLRASLIDAEAGRAK